MAAVVVKRFVEKFENGGSQHFSIRRWEDGSFQLFHDDPYVGIPQPYKFDYLQISGRFAEELTAEAELVRIKPNVEIDPP
jgi:hypothetical protein